MAISAPPAHALDHIGPWRIEQVLGRGGAGTVFAGRGPDGARVAIKVPDEGGVRAQWLLHEARFAARLRHPNIVSLEGRGSLPDGRPYLVYELVEGRALDQCADSLAARDVVRVGAELLSALTYAHDVGVLHLDLSPANVLLDEEGRAMLTDFGLAMSDDRRSRDATRRALVAGTPGYLSPEQAIGSGGVGPRADIYGAGALLYRLIAGFPPHFGSDSTEVIRRTLHGEPLPLTPRPGLLLSDDACNLVMAMLARDPEARPVSAARARRRWLEATDGLLMLRDGPPSSPTPAVPLRRPASFMLTEVGIAGDAPTADVRATRTSRRRPRNAGDRVVAPVPPLVGRRDALDAMAEHRAESGLLWVVGDAGVGVSRLLDEHVHHLHRDDALVARATGRRGIAGLPCEVLAALLLDLMDGFGLPTWAGAERLVAGIEALTTTPLEAATIALSGALLGTGRPTTAATLMECFRAALLLRPQGRALAMVVDDADRIDGASEEVLRRLAAEGVQVVLGGREGRPGDTVLRVQPLEAREARELAASIGAPDPDATVDALGGLPAAIVACARFDGDPRRRMLDTLSSEGRALLEAAALFGGGHVPLRALPDIAAAASKASDLPELDALLVPIPRAAARLEPWARVTDPGLLSELTPDAETRDRAIRWLARECRDQSFGVQALTARLAADAGQIAKAAFAAAEAGRRAAGCDAPEAQELLALALELSTGVPEAVDRPALEAALAELEVRTDPSAAFERAGRVVSEALPERRVLRARMRRLQAQVRIDERDSESALLLLNLGLALLDDPGDPEEMAELLSSKGWVLGYLQGDNEAGIALGRRAIAIASKVDTPAFQARLCGKLGANQLRAGDWDGQLATNLRDLGLSGIAQDVFGVMRAHINLGVCYTNRGLLGLARAHTAEAARLGDDFGTLRAAQIAWNNLALIAADDGRWEDAREAAEESRSRCSSEAMEIAETWEVLLRCELAAGNEAAARAALARLEALATGAERALAVRAATRFMEPADAIDTLDGVLSEGIGDPYDRAKTELALAAAYRAAGDDVGAASLERRADQVFTTLGANPALERRRVAPI